MDAQAFQAIQAKLLRQRGEMGNLPAQVPIDWPTPHGVRVHSTAVRAAETVDMLQRRSRQAGGVPNPMAGQPMTGQPMTGQPMTGQPMTGQPRTRASAPDRRMTPAAYRRRMAMMAQRINDLSLEQEQAIAEMQWVQQQSDALAADPTAAYPHPPAIRFDQAVTAWASLDETGRVVLSYRPVDPHPAHAAHALADHLRHTYGAPQGRRRASNPSPRLWPALHRLGHRLVSAIPLWVSRPSLGQGSELEPYPAPSTSEAMLWAGAGVVGRLTLQGLLMVVPSLGLVAVVACLASLALTLYRAILPPSPDINLISRVGLALGGLFIGGYLI